MHEMKELGWGHDRSRRLVGVRRPLAGGGDSLAAEFDRLGVFESRAAADDWGLAPSRNEGRPDAAAIACFSMIANFAQLLQ